MPDENEFFDISKISTLNLDKIVALLPGSPLWSAISDKTQGKYVQAFLNSEAVLEAAGINTALRLAHFLGQGIIETGYLRATTESLNYSAERLCAVFPSRFPNVEAAQPFAHDEEKLGNNIYSDRMGNGDAASGDGFKYRGRGFIQLTGRNNYTKYAGITGLPLVEDPDLISRDLEASIRVAASFFSENNLLPFADSHNAIAVSRGVNRGNPNSLSPAIDEAHRIAWTEKALSLFSMEETELVSPRNGGLLKVGDRGELVAEFQRILATLGFAVGGVDGDFGPNTRNAVKLFQEQAGLIMTGEIEQITANAMDAALADANSTAVRPNADEETLKSTGDKLPGNTDAISGTGIVAGAGAVIAGVAGAMAAGGDDSAGAAPSNTSTEQPEPPTPPASTGGGIDWGLIAIGGAVIAIIAVVVMLYLARKTKKDQIQAYRDGRVV